MGSKFSIAEPVLPLPTFCPCLLTPQWHLMSSNSPSGGMKLMLRSESNLLSRTHWWKVQSSMAIDCFPLQEGTGSLIGTGEWQDGVMLGGYPTHKGARTCMRLLPYTIKLPGCSFDLGVHVPDLEMSGSSAAWTQKFQVQRTEALHIHRSALVLGTKQRGLVPE